MPFAQPDGRRAAIAMLGLGAVCGILFLSVWTWLQCQLLVACIGNADEFREGTISRSFVGPGAWLRAAASTWKPRGLNSFTIADAVDQTTSVGCVAFFRPAGDEAPRTLVAWLSTLCAFAVASMMLTRYRWFCVNGQCFDSQILWSSACPRTRALVTVLFGASVTACVIPMSTASWALWTERSPQTVSPSQIVLPRLWAILLSACVFWCVARVFAMFVVRLLYHRLGSDARFLSRCCNGCRYPLKHLATEVCPECGLGLQSAESPATMRRLRTHPGRAAWFVWMPCLLLLATSGIGLSEQHARRSPLETALNWVSFASGLWSNSNQIFIKQAGPSVRVEWRHDALELSTRIVADSAAGRVIAVDWRWDGIDHPVQQCGQSNLYVAKASPLPPEGWLLGPNVISPPGDNRVVVLDAAPESIAPSVVFLRIDGVKPNRVIRTAFAHGTR